MGARQGKGGRALVDGIKKILHQELIQPTITLLLLKRSFSSQRIWSKVYEFTVKNERTSCVKTSDLDVSYESGAELLPCNNLSKVWVKFLPSCVKHLKLSHESCHFLCIDLTQA